MGTIRTSDGTEIYYKDWGTKTLAGHGVQTPQTAHWAEHVWHVYAVRTPSREELRSALAAHGVATGIHYPVPLHLQPALAHLGYARGAFPVTEAWADVVLSLPMFAELEPHEIEHVAGIAAASQATAA